MSKKVIKKIPYGISDYEKIVRDNCYYVDKTGFIEPLEKAGDYLFFIRPRRFGKSLFLSVLQGYYDVRFKDRFDELFKGTYIHDHPTAERGNYLVLPFNFSAVDPDIRRVETSFLYYVKEQADLFIYAYAGQLGIRYEENEEFIKQLESPPDVLRYLIKLCKKSSRKIYILIDEYDNFANTILSIHGEYEYEKLTHGDSFFRAFFNVLKEGTGGMGAPISRLLLTGVSPVTLDDVTSGFNIGKNISIDPNFNSMLGFSETDVIQVIEHYRAAGLIQHETAHLLEIMKQWYNNYIFSKKTKNTLFNSDMVLYFIDEYSRYSGIPDDLIDRNVRIDYGKLRHLIITDREDKKSVNGNFSKLRQIIEDGRIVSKLEKGFPAEKIILPQNFISLLFYFGLLTIEGEKEGELVLTIPNETVKRLYYDYISEGYDETGTFSMDLYRYDRLMHAMGYKGEWQPLFEYIAGLMRESIGLRDLITGEKSIQAFLNVYLGLSNLYIIHVEREFNRGYADLMLAPFKIRYKGIEYSYILEIKYIKKEGRKEIPPKEIEAKIKEAEEQLKKYSLDAKLKKMIDQTVLVKLALIFSGSELLHIVEVKD